MASARAARPPAPPFIDPPGYARHRPEKTLLYRLVEEQYPAHLGDSRGIRLARMPGAHDELGLDVPRTGSHAADATPRVDQ